MRFGWGDRQRVRETMGNHELHLSAATGAIARLPFCSQNVLMHIEAWVHYDRKISR
jgi:hypothetical protein